MSATGFTPISLYYTTTASAVPTAGNLVNGELALNINTADGKLFYKDSAGVVQVLATRDSTSGSFTNLAYTGTLTGGTGVVNLGSGQFYKDASGNIGVGTASPVSVGGYGSLTVNGTTGSLVYLQTNASSAMQISTNASGAAITAIGASLPLYFSTNSTERMRIDSSGNVGIGTASPARSLDVRKAYTADTIVAQIGNINNGNGATPVATIFDFTEANGTSVSRISSIYTQSAGTTSLAFGTFSGGSLAEKMRIDSSGNLLIGTTSSWSANVKTQITGTTSLSCTTPLTVAQDQIYFRNPNGIVGVITSTGSATAYVTTSDYRLKENIEPMTGALAKVSQLKPVTYKWKVDGSDGEGFIAHELQAVVPECVTGEKDAVNEDGSIKSQGIDTSFLVATLTAAIKEQQAIIENLTTRLTALENK